MLFLNSKRAPKAVVDVNGVTLLLEGDVSAMFRRKNKVHNLLSANGQLRVGVSLWEIGWGRGRERESGPGIRKWGDEGGGEG